MSERFTRGNDAYYAWMAIRPRARITEAGIEIWAEGKGRYTLEIDFRGDQRIDLSLRDAVGPTSDLVALTRAVHTANAEGGEPLFELDDPFVFLRCSVLYVDGGVSLDELEAARQGLLARMDAHHEAFCAPGRRPFGVHIDDDGVGTLVPPSSGRHDPSVDE